MHRRALFAAFAALLFATLIQVGRGQANPDFDLGPAINAKAPDIGTPPDQTGTPRALPSLMGEKGMVLFFFRSADWCPFCQAQMMDLNTAIAGIERRGYKMAGISYDSPAILKTFIERRGIGYTLLSDPKSQIIDRYKLRDPQYPPGNFAYGVPRPIIFILDKNGVIKAKLYEETYTKRPPATLVIETLDRLAKG
ncbi:MAG TPA: peroxiredoxin family protein [Micropepsaceae bacterium]|nr:peroxiredoxin family protein [Micropepsaceae bacterium]